MLRVVVAGHDAAVLDSATRGSKSINTSIRSWTRRRTQSRSSRSGTGRSSPPCGSRTARRSLRSPARPRRRARLSPVAGAARVSAGLSRAARCRPRAPCLRLHPGPPGVDLDEAVGLLQPLSSVAVKRPSLTLASTPPVRPRARSMPRGHVFLLSAAAVRHCGISSTASAHS